MSLGTRANGIAASVFTVGGTAYIGDLISAGFTLTNKEENIKGIADVTDYNAFAGRDWTLEGNLFATTGVSPMDLANSSTPVVAITWTSGAENYAGSALIASCRHSAERDAFQKYDVTLRAYGSVTIT